RRPGRSGSSVQPLQQWEQFAVLAGEAIHQGVEYRTRFTAIPVPIRFDRSGVPFLRVSEEGGSQTPHLVLERLPGSRSLLVIALDQARIKRPVFELQMRKQS